MDKKSTEKSSMDRRDSMNSADVYALSKMEPLAKKSSNAQVVLMYERLNAGKKILGEVFDKMIVNTIDGGALDMRLLNCVQNMSDEMNETKIILTEMQQQKEKISVLEDEVRISQGLFREALREVQKDNKNIKKLCNSALQKKGKDRVEDIEPFMELKDKTDEIQKLLDGMLAENKRISKNFQELMEYARIYHGSISNLQKQNDILQESKATMKKISDRNQYITKNFAQMSAQIGKMAQDRFYMMDNTIFKGILSTAATCHKEWMRNFRRYVDSGRDNELQFDSKLSGFGICYYSVYPRHKDVIKEWNTIGKLHEQIHEYAYESIKKVQKNELEEARMIYEQAKDLSEVLLGQVDLIAKKLKGIEKRKENVFES